LTGGRNFEKRVGVVLGLGWCRASDGPTEMREFSNTDGERADRDLDGQTSDCDPTVHSYHRPVGCTYPGPPVCLDDVHRFAPLKLRVVEGEDPFVGFEQLVGVHVARRGGGVIPRVVKSRPRN